MKKCPFCGTELADDNLFCTECGKQIPQGKVCSNCGAAVSEDDIFCANCGKGMDVKSTEIHIEENSHTCPYCGTIIHDGDAFCQNCGKSIKESPNSSSIISEDVKKSSIGKYLPYIIGAFVLLMIIGYCYSYSIRPNSDESLVKDTVNTNTNIEDNKQVVKAKIDFLETFYKQKNFADQALEYSYIKRNVTVNGLNDLKELYDFDCDGECLATWVFDFNDGSDIGELKNSKITSVGGNDFLVEKEYENAKYSVLLTVVKEDGVFKIDKIKPKETLNTLPKQVETENLDWLQGHWVYDIDVSTDKHYRIHVVIDGNRIMQYRKDPSESTSPTFTIENDEIQAQYESGLITYYKIDPVRQAIDIEDGKRWMYKLGSNEEIKHRVGFETENVLFIKIENQVFRSRDGKEIRFDGKKGVYINDVFAGTLEVEKLEKVKAIVKYSGGECEEGKLEIQTNCMTRNFLMILTIPFDGFYEQIR